MSAMDQNFTCEHCNTTFARRDALRRHIQTVHGQDGIQCTSCGRSFSRQDALRRHAAKCVVSFL